MLTTTKITDERTENIYTFEELRHRALDMLSSLGDVKDFEFVTLTGGGWLLWRAYAISRTEIPRVYYADLRFRCPSEEAE